MKITKIEKKKRLYFISFDNAENLYVTEDTIVHFMLTKGKTITTEELEEIQTFAQLSDAKNKALYYISFQQRTQLDVKHYLKERDFSETIITSVITQLLSEKWLDDRQYTTSYLQQNLSHGDKGPFFITQKLKEKGIDGAIISEELNQIDMTPLAEKICLKLLKKYEKQTSLKTLKQKILQNMSQKGFDYHLIQSILNSLELEKDDERESELLKKECDKVYRKYQRRYDGYELKQRTLQALLRKGFDYADITNILSHYNI